MTTQQVTDLVADVKQHVRDATIAIKTVACMAHTGSVSVSDARMEMNAIEREIATQAAETVYKHLRAHIQ